MTARWTQDELVDEIKDGDTEVLAVLEEDLLDAHVPALTSFISTAHARAEAAVRQQGRESNYCDRLFSPIIPHVQRVLPLLTDETRRELHQFARRLVTSVALNCSLRAAVVLKHVGQPEDATLLEAHRPTEPVLAKAFDDTVRAFRGRMDSSVTSS